MGYECGKTGTRALALDESRGSSPPPRAITTAAVGGDRWKRPLEAAPPRPAGRGRARSADPHPAPGLSGCQRRPGGSGYAPARPGRAGRGLAAGAGSGRGGSGPGLAAAAQLRGGCGRASPRTRRGDAAGGCDFQRAAWTERVGGGGSSSNSSSGREGKKVSAALMPGVRATGPVRGAAGPGSLPAAQARGPAGPGPSGRRGWAELGDSAAIPALHRPGLCRGPGARPAGAAAATGGCAAGARSRCPERGGAWAGPGRLLGAPCPGSAGWRAEAVREVPRLCVRGGVCSRSEVGNSLTRLICWQRGASEWCPCGTSPRAGLESFAGLD